MKGKKSKQKKTFFAKEYYMLLELCQKAYEDVAWGAFGCFGWHELGSLLGKTE